MVLAKTKLGIEPEKFWRLTFGEFWPLYEALVVKPSEPQVKPMSKKELVDLNKRFLSGKFGGVSSKSSSGDKRA